MDIYPPIEIQKKIKGVSTRMLTDLAEKGFIIPAKEHYGPGSPRLYDKDNLLEIMFAVAVRGMFSNNNMRQMLKILRENANKPVAYMVLTHIDRNRITEKVHIRFIKKSEKLKLNEIMAGSGGETPRTDVDKYLSVVVDIAGMKKFIEENF